MGTTFDDADGTAVLSCPGVRSMIRRMSILPASASTEGLSSVASPSRRHNSSLTARHWSMLPRVRCIFLRVRRLAVQMTMWLCRWFLSRCVETTYRYSPPVIASANAMPISCTRSGVTFSSGANECFRCSASTLPSRMPFAHDSRSRIMGPASFPASCRSPL